MSQKIVELGSYAHKDNSEILLSGYRLLLFYCSYYYIRQIWEWIMQTSKHRGSFGETYDDPHTGILLIKDLTISFSNFMINNERNIWLKQCCAKYYRYTIFLLQGSIFVKCNNLLFTTANADNTNIDNTNTILNSSYKIYGAIILFPHSVVPYKGFTIWENSHSC